MLLAAAIFVVAVVQGVSADCTLTSSVGQLIESCRVVKECPDGWVYNRQTAACYILHAEEHTWHDAQDRCQALGADLVSANTKAEFGFVWDYVTSVLGDKWESNLWLGLKRYGDGWKWVDGEDLTIRPAAFWFPGEPNNARGDEDVALMYHMGLMNDASPQPDYINFSVCEKAL